MLYSCGMFAAAFSLDQCLTIMAKVLCLNPLEFRIRALPATSTLSHLLGITLALLGLALYTQSWSNAQIVQKLGLKLCHWRDYALGSYLGLAVGFSAMATRQPSDVSAEGIFSEFITSNPIWIFSLLAVAPLTEEFLFRGVLLSGLVESLGSWRGVLTTTLLFLSVHFSWSATSIFPLLSIACVSIVTAWLRLRTGSIVPPILCHFFYNLMVLALP